MSDTTSTPPAGGMRKQKDGSTLHEDGVSANYAWIQHFVHQAAAFFNVGNTLQTNLPQPKTFKKHTG